MPVDRNAVGNTGCCTCGAPPPPATCGPSTCGSGCAGIFMPGIMIVNDAFGTLNLTWDPGSSSWSGCRIITGVTVVTGCTATGCLPYTTGGGTLCETYKLTCNPWTIARTFGYLSWLDQCTPQANHFDYVASTCSGTIPCTPVPSAFCSGNPIQQSNSCTSRASGWTPTSCYPFSWSGTLTTTPGCALPDPISGLSISITGQSGSGGSNCVSCSACSFGVPNILYISDSTNTNVPATWNGSVWVTGILGAPSSGFCTTCPAGNPGCGPVTCTPAILYSISCGATNILNITRRWYSLNVNYCTIGGPSQYISSTCNPSGGYGGYNNASSTANVTITCGSISGSVSLTSSYGGLTDPAAGTVSFTQ